MEVSRLPAALKLSGNIANNWKTFKQQFEIYMLATEKSTKKAAEIKIAIFLNLIGEDGVQQ